MVAGFSTSEVEDFHSSIRQLRFKDNDFELSHTPVPLSGGGIQPIVGMVTVKRKSTGVVV